MKDGIGSIVLRILMWVISLVLAPLGLMVEVIGFFRRRDPQELERVGVGAVAGGLAQILLIQTDAGVSGLLQGMLVGTLFGALLVIAIAWIGYIVGAILGSLYWMLQRRPGSERGRNPELELVIWGAVVGALSAAVGAERNQAQVEFIWALTGGGIIGALVGAFGEYLKKMRQ
jgi:hypothetical protein